MPIHRSVWMLLLAVAATACAPSDAPSSDVDRQSAVQAPSDPGTRDGATGTVPPPPAGATSSGVGSGEPGGLSVPAPEDRPVVVFLGTSLTAGLGLPTDDDTYVARTAELAEAAGVPFTAVNAGVSGETSAAGLRRIDWVLRQPLDVLVLELGANDGLRGLGLDQLRANLEGIIERTRERYPDAAIVLAGMEAPPNMGAAYTESFRQVYREVAEAEGVRLVPFLLEGVAGVPELNQSDGIHPTPEGHRRMAENLWPVLEDALDAVTAR